MKRRTHGNREEGQSDVARTNSSDQSIPSARMVNEEPMTLQSTNKEPAIARDLDSRGRTKQSEMEKSKAVITVEIIEYESHSVVRKTIIDKTTGNVQVMSFDHGEAVVEKIIPFDSFAQIIEGRAEIVIDGQSNVLDAGQSIIIPAHTPNIVIAKERFKMIMTIIKSGYE